MSNTTIQAELPPELVNRARDFVAKSGLPGFSELVKEALQDFFKQHGGDLPPGTSETERQQVFHALAAQAETCAKSGWDGHGAEAVSLDAYRCAYRLVESLPPGFPMPGVGAEPDGHLTLEWYRSPSRVLSVSVSPAGELNYAALLGDASRRTGSEIFSGEPPADLLHLIRQLFAA